MTKWEYRVDITEVGGGGGRTLDKMTNGWLNNIGSDGWELVTINTTAVAGTSTQKCYLVFKRPVE